MGQIPYRDRIQALILSTLPPSQICASGQRSYQNGAIDSVAPRLAIFQGPGGESLTAELEPIHKMMASPSDRKILTEEFENCLKRSLLREGHELLLWYCEETGQFETYKNVPWFQFARIIRNVASHKQGGILRNWPGDLTEKGITRVSWRSRTFDTSMVGREIELTHYEVLQLFLDQLYFAGNSLA